MSGTLGDLMLAGTRYLTGEQPKLQAETQETWAKVPYTQAATLKTQMDAELTRIQAQAGSKQMEMIAKGMGGDNTQMPQSDPNATPYYSPSAAAPAPAQAAAPPPTAEPAVVPGSDARFGAAPPPAPPPAVAAPAITPQGTGLAARYPGAYNVADVSGTTPPPASTALAQNANAPAPAPVAVQPPPPAPAPAPLAPMPGGPPGVGSAQLAQAGAPAPAAPGGYNPQGTSSNGINIPGVGPLPYWAAASMYGAISRGQDPMQAMHAAAEQRYRRLAELARQGDSPDRWNANVLQAWREGLIDNASYNAELNHPEKRENLVLSLTDAAHQSQLQANLATQGMAVGPGGIGTAPMAQAAIEGAQGARAAGEGRLVDVKVWNDPSDPTKGFTIQQVPAPGVYRFMREHTGAEVMGASSFTKDTAFAGLVGNEGSGPDAVSSAGARGRAQIMPETFARFKQGNESYANENDRVAAAKRYSDYLYDKYNGDPGRIATAYFSGEGNVAPPGSPTPYVTDKRDTNGVATSNYVARYQSRFGGGRASAVPQRMGLGGGGNAPLGQGAPPAPGSLIAQAAANPNATIQAPPVATARATPAAGNTVAMGDSHAGGLRTAGLPAVFSNGANPQAVLTTIRNTPAEQIAGKDIVLSGGFSNDGNHQNTGLVTEQVAALKEKGAKSVSVLGVGPGAGGDAVNNQLALNAGPGGYRFVPLQGEFQPGGVHLRNYSPIANQVRTSQAGQPEFQPYQTAALGFVPPPTARRPGVDTGADTGAPPGGATQAQYLGLPPGPVRGMPSEWNPGPAVTSNVKLDEDTRQADAGKMETRQQESLAGQTAMRTMGDIVHRLDAVGGFTGAGAPFRVKLGQALKDFAPPVVERIFAAVGGDKFDPKNVDEVRILAKELFGQATQMERGLTGQGGQALTRMFADMMPNIGMSGDAIRDMNNVLRVMQQASLDYNQGAIEHFNRERQWAPLQRDAQGGGYTRYRPLSEYDQKFNNVNGPNAPVTYVGTAGLLNKRKDWYAGMNRRQQEAAIGRAVDVDPTFILRKEFLPPDWK